jgi:hypothetical protein
VSPKLIDLNGCAFDQEKKLYIDSGSHTVKDIPRHTLSNDGPLQLLYTVTPLLRDLKLVLSISQYVLDLVSFSRAGLHVFFHSLIDT